VDDLRTGIFFLCFWLPAKSNHGTVFERIGTDLAKFHWSGRAHGSAWFVWLFQTGLESAFGCLLIFLGNFIFYINYRVLDKDTMFLPAFIMVAFFIAAGLQEGFQFINNKTFDFKTKQTIATIQSLFWAVIIVLSCAINWQWTNLSNFVGPETYSSMILASVESGSTIVAGWSPAVVLEYEQLVAGKRSDIHIYNHSRSEVAIYYRYWSQRLPENQIMTCVKQEELDLIGQFYKRGKVYSIDFDSDLAGNYEFLPAGTYYQLEKKAN